MLVEILNLQISTKKKDYQSKPNSLNMNNQTQEFRSDLDRSASSDIIR